MGHGMPWTLEGSVTTIAASKALSIRCLQGKRAISEMLPCNLRAPYCVKLAGAAGKKEAPTEVGA
jgi:hypothetical protein